MEVKKWCRSATRQRRSGNLQFNISNVDVVDGIEKETWEGISEGFESAQQSLPPKVLADNHHHRRDCWSGRTQSRAIIRFETTSMRHKSPRFQAKQQRCSGQQTYPRSVIPSSCGVINTLDRRTSAPTPWLWSTVARRRSQEHVKHIST